MKLNTSIVTRIAPSPTGNLHIGGVRTALFNHLFARKNNGKFILRIEDTDRERSRKKYEENILESFEWLGLKYDELYRQSEREEIYKKYLRQLLDSDRAYVSKEAEGNRTEVVRFRNPNKKVSFHDIIRGDVEFDTTDLGDFVIAKSLEEPLYHLAVVVDDFEMGITHVIRGEEHLSNTPRQILIQEAISAACPDKAVARPEYAHIPLILAKDRSKLSKRAGAVSALEYRDLGYLPEAVLNYLALLGWNPGTEREIFSLAELVEQFDLGKIQKGGAVFDEIKLRWVNKEHMKLQRDKIQETITKKIQERYNLQKIHPGIAQIIFEHIETLKDIDEMIGAGELEYFFREPDVDRSKIAWRGTSIEETKENLEKVVERLQHDKLTDPARSIEALAEERGKGAVLWPLRYALSGREKSPDPFTLMQILGQKESEKRVSKAIEIL